MLYKYCPAGCCQHCQLSPLASRHPSTTTRSTLIQVQVRDRTGLHILLVGAGGTQKGTKRECTAPAHRMSKYSLQHCVSASGSANVCNGNLRVTEARAIPCYFGRRKRQHRDTTLSRHAEGRSASISPELSQSLQDCVCGDTGVSPGCRQSGRKRSRRLWS